MFSFWAADQRCIYKYIGILGQEYKEGDFEKNNYLESTVRKC